MNVELTNRENEVLEYHSWGASAKEIAESLFISTVTVQNHIHNIKDKLHLQKATELASWFFCHRFNISMDLSPLKRSIASIAMILLISFEMYNFDGSSFRARRVKTGRKGETELTEFE